MDTELAETLPRVFIEAGASPVIADLADLPSAPTLKNQDRIDELRSRMFARHTVTLRTSFCSRNLRRDFNIASAKMYVYSLNRPYREKISEALSDLHWQIAILGSDPVILAFGALDVSWLNGGTFDFVMVSPESASMFRALRKLDELVARLFTAERQDLITRDQRRALMGPIDMAYAGFKQVAMKLANKSIEDLLAETNLA
jgi:hypothetical protein